MSIPALRKEFREKKAFFIGHQWKKLDCLLVKVFVAFVEDNATMSSLRYFEKSCIIFCAKPKDVDPIKLISLRQKKSLSIALKYIINNSCENKQN